MVIKAGQWAVDVRWYSGLEVVSTGVKYKLTSSTDTPATIPLNSCLKLNGLQWASTNAGGKVGVLAHVDVERLNAQWALEVLE